MTSQAEAHLLTCDLVIDAVYRGYKTEKGGMADPLPKLVGVSRQGGFRYRGTLAQPTLLVLTSNMTEVDWPDELDPTTGRFVYYGDNRHPGLQLHDTQRFGNQLLISLFDCAHGGRRTQIPPTLIFTSENPGRSYRFRGLAVPGHPNMPATEDLVAIWKTDGSSRFQNYRSVFTILDVPVINRRWIESIRSGLPDMESAPPAWRAWLEKGVVKPLEAPKTQLIRTKKEQLPNTAADQALIEVIRSRYTSNAYAFEACAGAITRLILGNVTHLDLTRPWRDGGRDGIGTARLGRGPASIEVTFALEAKCYGVKSSVGVKEVSRLISRIKHREFGVLVTTSFVHEQAYREVIDDGHPVVLVTAIDIVQSLREAGYSTPSLVSNWLDGIAQIA
jgi:hypothetical protein